MHHVIRAVPPHTLPIRKFQPGGSGLAESGQTLQGSFSAVSKPNFANKYAFESSRRDLQNALLCTALKSHFMKFFILFYAKNARIWF